MTILPVDADFSQANADALDAAQSRSEMLSLLVAFLSVKLPDGATDATIVAQPEPPNSDSSARVWVRTTAPTFVAVRHNGSWLALGTNNGLIVPYDSSRPEEMSEAHVIPLTAEESTKYGIAAGVWGRIARPEITGVTYS